MPNPFNRSVPKAVLQLMVFGFLQAACLFGSAGTLAWWNGWAFLAYNIASGASVSFGLYRQSPELEKERRTASKKAKSWDKLIVFLLVLVFPLCTWILSGLDKRFGWTRTITTFTSLGALLVMVASSVLIFGAMKSNPFFSSFVRIQKDRGHVVVKGGPYGTIRHPAYLGMILGGLAIPIELGSLAALGVGVANGLLVLARTCLEDRTLTAELGGYREYAQRVRYRLVPFLW